MNILKGSKGAITLIVLAILGVTTLSSLLMMKIANNKANTAKRYLINKELTKNALYAAKTMAMNTYAGTFVINGESPNITVTDNDVNEALWEKKPSTNDTITFTVCSWQNLPLNKFNSLFGNQNSFSNAISNCPASKTQTIDVQITDHVLATNIVTAKVTSKMPNPAGGFYTKVNTVRFSTVSMAPPPGPCAPLTGDIKINGSDGPVVSLTCSEQYNLTWTSTCASNCTVTASGCNYSPSISYSGTAGSASQRCTKDDNNLIPITYNINCDSTPNLDPITVNFDNSAGTCGMASHPCTNCGINSCDVNIDGNVDAADKALVSANIGISTASCNATTGYIDVNADDTVDATDVNLIQEYIDYVNNSYVGPAPYCAYHANGGGFCNDAQCSSGTIGDIQISDNQNNITVDCGQTYYLTWAYCGDIGTKTCTISENGCGFTNTYNSPPNQLASGGPINRSCSLSGGQSIVYKMLCSDTAPAIDDQITVTVRDNCPGACPSPNPATLKINGAHINPTNVVCNNSYNVSWSYCPLSGKSCNVTEVGCGWNNTYNDAVVGGPPTWTATKIRTCAINNSSIVYNIDCGSGSEDTLTVNVDNSCVGPGAFANCHNCNAPKYSCDVDNDGDVDAEDSGAISAYITTPFSATSCPEMHDLGYENRSYSLDVNNDGLVNGSDFTIINDYLTSCGGAGCTSANVCYRQIDLGNGCYGVSNCGYSYDGSNYCTGPDGYEGLGDYCHLECDSVAVTHNKWMNDLNNSMAGNCSCNCYGFIECGPAPPPPMSSTCTTQAQPCKP